MIRVHNALKNHKSRLILQVHDELLLEVYKPELEEVRQILIKEMSEAAKLSVPLVVDVPEGENWYDAK
ncbi:MAG: DNA polymerase I, partial [Firmicutes bacterium]|nr:DNA polymerase I [Bacillota bacterium]